MASCGVIYLRSFMKIDVDFQAILEVYIKKKFDRI